jgi:D-alanyl-D-alanine carboxypeptidase
MDSSLFLQKRDDRTDAKEHRPLQRHHSEALRTFPVFWRRTTFASLIAWGSSATTSAHLRDRSSAGSKPATCVRRIPHWRSDWEPSSPYRASVSIGDRPSRWMVSECESNAAPKQANTRGRTLVADSEVPIHSGRRCLILGAAASLAGCRRESAKFGSRPALDRVRRTHGVPAIGTIALRSGEVLETDAVGVLRQGRVESVGIMSEFHLGSLAKAFTATMLATLVEEGKLAWDTGPLDVFPEWKGTVRPEYARISVDDLLRHRAGLAAFKPVGASEFSGFPVSASRSECARWVLRTPPAKPPGTAPMYSNAGPSIASAMAERVTGTEWERLIRERVLIPLGIKGGFGWPARNHSMQPWGHRPSWLGPRPVDPLSPYPLPDFFRPAGDIRMCVTDYARFLRLHLAGLRGSDGLLKASTVQHLHTPLDSYGLGWGVGLMDGVLSSGHVGSAGGFLTVASIWPGSDLAAAAVTNLESSEALEAANFALKNIRVRFGCA